jgi:sugar-specific transcriptional regulator TrmB
VATLERFGFTPTETRVYEVLLRIGASTGYAVSKAAGLARANTYQALDGLVRRGAARRSATIPARYAALTPDAVVGELERGFRRDLETLHQALRTLPRAARASGDGVTVFDRWDEFEQHAATTVIRAREEVLAVAGGWAGTVLGALADRAAQGLAVRAVSLGDAGGPQGIAVRPVSTDDLVSYWSGLPVALVVDRTEALTGLRLPDGTGSGMATTNATLVPFMRHLLRRELAGVGAS